LISGLFLIFNKAFFGKRFDAVLTIRKIISVNSINYFKVNLNLVRNLYLK